MLWLKTPAQCLSRVASSQSIVLHPTVIPTSNHVGNSITPPTDPTRSASQATRSRASASRSPCTAIFAKAHLRPDSQSSDPRNLAPSHLHGYVGTLTHTKKEEAGKIKRSSEVSGMRGANPALLPIQENSIRLIRQLGAQMQTKTELQLHSPRPRDFLSWERKMCSCTRRKMTAPLPDEQHGHTVRTHAHARPFAHEVVD